ncbi:MAG TPA: ATP-binding protein [Streptosporangiaceae bacterium]|nr:ATP-binding protein [Streptosporangiaceae bacterium]
MAKPGRPWIGQLGLRLALAFVGVALAAVLASILLGTVTTSRDVDELIAAQHHDLAQATAKAAAAAYQDGHWVPQDLAPVLDFVKRAGAVVAVQTLDGRQLKSSRQFEAGNQASQIRAPVRTASGAPVGSVTIRFENQGLDETITRFQARRWPSRIGAAGVAALIALIVALVLSRKITAPIESLIDTARARGRGEFGARAGDVRGIGEIQELAEAFDEMAAAREEQDQVRRNLVADVAHELRTPIAVLQAGHEAMLDGLTKPTSANLTSLRDEVLRLARMVDDLQRLASAEAAALQLRLVPRDLAGTVAKAADSLDDAFAAAGLTLERKLAEIQVDCDPLRIHEVTTNLLTNAMKFTPAGGRVVLEAGPDEDHEAGMAVLRVTDTGIGIPAGELPLVTQRFFRGQRSAGIAGSGIGLTIVAELVRAHHGRMDITSEARAGTQVTIMLPGVVSAAARDEHAKRGAAEAHVLQDRQPEISTKKASAPHPAAPPCPDVPP